MADKDNTGDGFGWKDGEDWQKKKAISDPYHNAATLLGGDDDDISIASSSEITLADINLASGSKGSPGRVSKNLEYDSDDDDDKKSMGKKDGVYMRRASFMKIAVVSTLLLMTTVTTLVLVSLNMTQSAKQSKTNYLMAGDTTDITQVSIPSNYDNLVDVSDPPADDNSAIPFLWDMPGDGDVLQNVLSKCLGLVFAGGTSHDSRQYKEEPLQTLKHKKRTFMNVDTGSVHGLESALARGLLDSDDVDVVFSPLVYEASAMFTAEHQGQLFGLFNHPVLRVMSVYRSSPEYAHKKMTLEDYLSGPEGAKHNDWLTRSLAGVSDGPLDEEQFEIAKQVLREKCLIGLATDMGGSFERILDHFGWEATSGVDLLTCERHKALAHGHDRDQVPEGSDDWKTIADHNPFDLRLWDVQKIVYVEQNPE